MPIYEYACTSCGERTEARQSFSDPPLEDCPICGGKLRKLYSPVGVVFKGSGFYSTDAKKDTSSSGRSDGSKPKPASEPSKGDVGKTSSSAPTSGSDKGSSSGKSE